MDIQSDPFSLLTIEIYDYPLDQFIVSDIFLILAIFGAEINARNVAMI